MVKVRVQVTSKLKEHSVNILLENDENMENEWYLENHKSDKSEIFRVGPNMDGDHSNVCVDRKLRDHEILNVKMVENWVIKGLWSGLNIMWSWKWHCDPDCLLNLPLKHYVCV